MNYMDHIAEKSRLIQNNTLYTKELGWNVFDDDGDKVAVTITVYDTRVRGTIVILIAESVKCLGWYQSSGEALEFAIDTARTMIAEHEVRQVQREID